MSDSIPPPPPDGYKEPYQYEEIESRRDYLASKNGRRMLVLLIILSVVGAWVFVSNYSIIDQVVVGIVGVSESQSQYVLIPFAVMVYIATIVIHEHLHRFAAEWFGYNTQIVWTLPNPYNIMTGKLVKREHNLIVLAIPFFTLSIVTYLLAALNLRPVITAILSIICMFNTPLSAGDLTGFLFLSRCPKGTKIWMSNKDGRQSFVYEPTEK